MAVTVHEGRAHRDAVAHLDADPFDTTHTYIRAAGDDVWHVCTFDTGEYHPLCATEPIVDGDVHLDGPLGIIAADLAVCTHNECQIIDSDMRSNAARVTQVIDAVSVSSDPAAAAGDLFAAVNALMSARQWFDLWDDVDLHVITELIATGITGCCDGLRRVRRTDPAVGARILVSGEAYTPHLADEVRAAVEGFGSDEVYATCNVVAQVWPGRPDELADVLLAHSPDNADALHAAILARTNELFASEAGDLVAVRTPQSDWQDLVVGYPTRTIRDTRSGERGGDLVTAMPLLAVTTIQSLIPAAVVLGPTDFDRFDRTSEVYADLAASTSYRDAQPQLWATALRLT